MKKSENSLIKRITDRAYDLWIISSRGRFDLSIDLMLGEQSFGVDLCKTLKLGDIDFCSAINQIQRQVNQRRNYFEKLKGA